MFRFNACECDFLGKCHRLAVHNRARPSAGGVRQTFGKAARPGCFVAGELSRCCSFRLYIIIRSSLASSNFPSIEMRFLMLNARNNVAISAYIYVAYEYSAKCGQIINSAEYAIPRERRVLHFVKLFLVESVREGGTKKRDVHIYVHRTYTYTYVSSRSYYILLNPLARFTVFYLHARETLFPQVACENSRARIGVN